ncbi:MAG: acylneuraminate cytidylyltransferase, partial [Clostridiales bacterium]|nr:acylneuraminate cytidylyltransferase [Clostridiales bacterium]
ATDNVTLDPVVFDALTQMENKRGFRYDVVITLQPTSPTLKSETLQKALHEFIESGSDTYISAVNKPHLAWTKRGGEFVKLYEKRLNRQQLPPHYIEAGAFLITKRECVSEQTRIGQNVIVYEISENEAIDIDSISDWVVAESILAKKRIVLRADGYKEIGMGHIYHCLTLAYNLTAHEVVFVTKNEHKDGINKLQSTNMNLKIVETDEEFFSFLSEYKPDIVVNDTLDTEAEYVARLKMLSKRVVCIEDLGSGAHEADAVVNALYDGMEQGQNVYSGSDYVCLRDEFLYSKPAEFHAEVQNIVVLFGGTDPSNLTKKAYLAARELHKELPNTRFTFIAGIGYDCDTNGIFTIEHENIFVVQDVNFISGILKTADLALTSQGRTVYELASMGVPSMVMAQNERERLHTFAQMENGFLNLGLGSEIEIHTLVSTMKWLICNPQTRVEMRKLMLRKDLKSGVTREINIILGERL